MCHHLPQKNGDHSGPRASSCSCLPTHQLFVALLQRDSCDVTGKGRKRDRKGGEERDGKRKERRGKEGDGEEGKMRRGDRMVEPYRVRWGANK